MEEKGNFFGLGEMRTCICIRACECTYVCIRNTHKRQRKRGKEKKKERGRKIKRERAHERENEKERCTLHSFSRIARERD